MYLGARKPKDRKKTKGPQKNQRTTKKPKDRKKTKGPQKNQRTAKKSKLFFTRNMYTDMHYILKVHCRYVWAFVYKYKQRGDFKGWIIKLTIWLKEI